VRLLVLIKAGVGRHEVVGVATHRGWAERIATHVLKGEKDGYHSVDCVEVESDTLPVIDRDGSYSNTVFWAEKVLFSAHKSNGKVDIR
jgi:hypothetical protein